MTSPTQRLIDLHSDDRYLSYCAYLADDGGEDESKRGAGKDGEGELPVSDHTDNSTDDEGCRPLSEGCHLVSHTTLYAVHVTGGKG